MPLDPSISLQVKPIQIQAPDPVQTLVTIAQLKNYQSQADMRDLQIMDARRKLATLQALRQPGSPLLELYGQGGGGQPSGSMVPASQLGGMGQQMPVQQMPVQQMPAQPMPGGGMADAPLSTTPSALPYQSNYVDTQRNRMTSQIPGAGNLPPADTAYGVAPEEYQSPMMQQRMRMQGMSPEEQAQFQVIQQRGQGVPGQAGVPGTEGVTLPQDRAQLEAQLQAQRPASGVPVGQQWQQAMPPGAMIQAQGNMAAFPGMVPAPPQRMPMQPLGGPQAPTPSATPPMAQPAAPVAPGGPQAPQAGQQGQMPSEQSLMQDATRRNQLYTRLLSNYDADISAPIVDTLMKLDSHTMAQKKGALEQQSTVAGMTYQLMSSVLDQDEAQRPAAYAQARQMAMQIGFPGARQLPEQYTPQTAQLVEYLATNARSTEIRVKQQMEMMQRVTEQHKADTERFAKQMEARKVETVDTPEGKQRLPVYPGAIAGQFGGTVGGSIEGQKLDIDRAKTLIDAAKLNEQEVKEVGNDVVIYDKYGNPQQTLKDVAPLLRAPGTTAPAGGGTSGAPGMAPGPGGMRVIGRSKESLAPYRAAVQKEAEQHVANRTVAQGQIDILKEIETLAAGGFYGPNVLNNAQLAAYNNQQLIAKGYDEKMLNNTRTMRERGAELVAARGLGTGVSEGDRKTYEQAYGSLNQAISPEQLKSSLASMRRVLDQRIMTANTTLTHIQKSGALPRAEGSGSGGVNLIPVPAERYDAWVQRWMASGLTEDQAKARIQSSGYRRQ